MAETNKPAEKNTGMAILAYFIFFVPLLTDAKDDPFVKFHVKQSLLLVLGMVAVAIIGIVPIIGWLIALLAPLGIFVLWIMGIINAAGGKKTELPVVGKYAEQWFKF